MTQNKDILANGEKTESKTAATPETKRTATGLFAILAIAATAAETLKSKIAKTATSAIVCVGLLAGVFGFQPNGMADSERPEFLWTPMYKEKVQKKITAVVETRGGGEVRAPRYFARYKNDTSRYSNYYPPGHAYAGDAYFIDYDEDGKTRKFVRTTRYYSLGRVVTQTTRLIGNTRRTVWSSRHLNLNYHQRVGEKTVEKSSV